ncbi:MAG TPA: hypothetical protein VL727_21990 [Puia sp.]|jgi:hypothetical protein|nr:hypothetical protein [Puia sp.]
MENSSTRSTGGSGKPPAPKFRGAPKNTITVDTPVQAGSQLLIECPDCGSPASEKVVIGKIPFDIPANSKLTITFDGADPTKP